MISGKVLNNLVKYPKGLVNFTKYSTNVINIEKLEKESALSSDVLDEEAIKRESEIQQKRDKSRLNPHHRNILHEFKPYDEPMHYSHGTVRYQRKMYGVYGAASGVNPVYCWPTKADMLDVKEYERLKYPHHLKEMIQISKRTRAEKEEAIIKRERDIVDKIKKLNGWMKDLQMKTAKKETEARVAKERKDKLIEEVRRHFGYTVDPRDEKFKEMLERKEKEQKKQMKEAKKKMKEAKMIEKLIAVGEKEANVEKTDEETQKQ